MNDEEKKPEEIARSLPRYIGPNPLLAVLPRYLKDPANYEKIQKTIYNAGLTKHDHSEVLDWAGCFYCQQRQKDRAYMMRRLGFTTGKQYLMWRRTHERIRSMKRDPIR